MIHIRKLLKASALTAAMVSGSATVQPALAAGDHFVGRGAYPYGGYGGVAAPEIGRVMGLPVPHRWWDFQYGPYDYGDGDYGPANNGP
jgi:hypothetical protein